MRSSPFDVRYRIGGPLIYSRITAALSSAVALNRAIELTSSTAETAYLIRRRDQLGSRINASCRQLKRGISTRCRPAAEVALARPVRRIP